jgi:hypothetical protein
MSPRHPEVEVKIESGDGVGQREHPYWSSYFAGQVFGELNRVDDPDRKQFLRKAMTLTPDAVPAYAAEWVTVLDERGFKVTSDERSNE